MENPIYHVVTLPHKVIYQPCILAKWNLFTKTFFLVILEGINLPETGNTWSIGQSLAEICQLVQNCKVCQSYKPKNRNLQ